MRFLGIEFARRNAESHRRRALHEARLLILIHDEKAEEHRCAADEHEALARMYERRVERLAAGEPVSFFPSTPGDTLPP